MKDMIYLIIWKSNPPMFVKFELYDKNMISHRFKSIRGKVWRNPVVFFKKHFPIRMTAVLRIVTSWKIDRIGLESFCLSNHQRQKNKTTCSACVRRERLFFHLDRFEIALIVNNLKLLTSHKEKLIDLYSYVV